jgi:hypothetical protein
VTARVADTPKHIDEPLADSAHNVAGAIPGPVGYSGFLAQNAGESATASRCVR